MEELNIILVGGEYTAHDFVKEHEKDVHTISEWKHILRENDLWYSIRSFDSLERLQAYESAIGDVENYLSDDFYTFAIISNTMIKKEN